MRQLSNISLLPNNAASVLPGFPTWYFFVFLGVALSLSAFLTLTAVLFIRRMGKMEKELKSVNEALQKSNEAKEIALQPITLLPDYSNRKQPASRNSSLLSSPPIMTFSQLKTIHSAKGTEMVDLEKATVLTVGPLGSKASLTRKNSLLGGLKDLV